MCANCCVIALHSYVLHQKRGSSEVAIQSMRFIKTLNITTSSI